jgi:hypothetical protein
MAISLLHPFNTAVADGSDATRVRPSNWDAEHALTIGTSQILGRATENAGDVEALTVAGTYDMLGWAEDTTTDFVQTAAPTGWTKLTTHNNKALRIVTGTVSSGGTTAFTSVFASRTIATANVPAHAHTFSVTSSTPSSQTVSFSGRTSWTYGHDEDSDSVNGSGGSGRIDGINRHNETISATTPAHTHTYSFTSSSIGSGTGWDFDVQYVDMILASRDA